MTNTEDVSSAGRLSVTQVVLYPAGGYTYGVGDRSIRCRRTMEYKTEITHGPTYQYVCNDCGRRVGRWETNTGNTAYTCETCNETYTLRGLGAYKVEKVRVK